MSAAKKSLFFFIFSLCCPGVTNPDRLIFGVHFVIFGFSHFYGTCLWGLSIFCNFFSTPCGTRQTGDVDIFWGHFFPFFAVYHEGYLRFSSSRAKMDVFILEPTVRKSRASRGNDDK